MEKPLTGLGPRGAAVAGAAALLALVAADGWSRGGGGENFGGGGSGGGSDGGGGDIGWLAYLLVRLCIEAPAIGIPLAIAVVAGLIWASRSGLLTARGTYRHSVVTRGASARAANAAARAAEAVRARDPDFDAEAFCARVQRAFTFVQTGWCAQDLKALRPFCSDGVVERFELQLAEQRELGYRNRMDDVAIRSVSPVGFYREGAVETLLVEIAASAADYRVSLADGALSTARGRCSRSSNSGPSSGAPARGRGPAAPA